MESLGLTVSVANGGTKNNDYSATNSPRRADIMICPNRFVCKDLVSQMLVEVVLLVTCFSFQSGYGQSCYVPGAYGCCNCAMQYMRFGCEFFTKKTLPLGILFWKLSAIIATFRQLLTSSNLDMQIPNHWNH